LGQRGRTVAVKAAVLALAGEDRKARTLVLGVAVEMDVAEIEPSRLRCKREKLLVRSDSCRDVARRLRPIALAEFLRGRRPRGQQRQWKGNPPNCPHAAIPLDPAPARSGFSSTGAQASAASDVHPCWYLDVHRQHQSADCGLTGLQGKAAGSEGEKEPEAVGQ